MGVSPLFPLRHLDKQEAQQTLLHLLARAPSQLNQKGSRWQLSTVRRACDFLTKHSLSGVWRLLRQLQIHYKRGREHIHSPDPDYEAKLAQIVERLQRAIESGGQIVFLFGDEMSFYRQPSVARDYWVAGRLQPLAERSVKSDTASRVISALNAVTGQTTSLQASKIGVKQLVRFYQQLRQTYPEAKTIYLVEDNWPIHFHAEVLAALEPQRTPFELRVPWSWPSEPRNKAARMNLPIQILPLPSYASWSNPIEKLWRKLRQEVLHQHRYADEWEELKQRVNEFLDQFKGGSKELLRYVGLTEQSKLYGALLRTQAAPT